jgi:hypothetical protein
LPRNTPGRMLIGTCSTQQQHDGKHNTHSTMSARGCHKAHPMLASSSLETCTAAFSRQTGLTCFCTAVTKLLHRH